MTTAAPPLPASAAVAVGEWWLPPVTLAMLLVIRLGFQFGAAPLPDEAYYWLWGQHLALSYHDHPPLHAWLQAATALIAGWNLVALRLMTWVTTAGTVVVLWRLAKRLAPARVVPQTVAMAAIFFASPLMFIFTAMTFPDHLLIFLTLWAAFLFCRFLQSVEDGSPGIAGLYLAATVLGLAGLTKYNALFLGLAVAATILAAPPLRRLLRNPHLYLAAALSLLIQTPVIVWNFTHGFSSYQYNLSSRLAFDWGRGPPHLFLFLIASAGVLSPFLIPPLIAFLRAPQPAPWNERWRTLGSWAFVLSIAAFSILAFFSFVQYYWNIVAYPVFLAAALAYFASRRLLAAHLVFGMVAAALFTANYALFPLAAVVGKADRESALVYGWDDIARRVLAAKQVEGLDFIAASDYRTAALLAFALKDPTVESISSRKDEFDFWLDPAGRAGRNALILAEGWHPIDQAIRDRFHAIEPISVFPITRFGVELKTYRLYRGLAYIPEGTDG